MPSLYQKAWTEARNLFKSDDYDFIQISSKTKDNSSSILFEMYGPEDTAYSGGVFEILLDFKAKTYPSRPMKIKFLTKIFHMNINSQGTVCHRLLIDQWEPKKTSIGDVMTVIHELLIDPSTHDALNQEAADLYLVDENSYYETAKEWTRQYATREMNNSNPNSPTMKPQCPPFKERSPRSRNRNNNNDNDNQNRRVSRPSVERGNIDDQKNAENDDMSQLPNPPSLQTTELIHNTSQQSPHSNNSNNSQYSPAPSPNPSLSSQKKPILHETTIALKKAQKDAVSRSASPAQQNQNQPYTFDTPTDIQRQTPDLISPISTASFSSTSHIFNTPPANRGSTVSSVFSGSSSIPLIDLNHPSIDISTKINFNDGTVNTDINLLRGYNLHDSFSNKFSFERMENKSSLKQASIDISDELTLLEGLKEGYFIYNIKFYLEAKKSILELVDGYQDKIKQLPNGSTGGNSNSGNTSYNSYTSSGYGSGGNGNGGDDNIGNNNNNNNSNNRNGNHGGGGGSGFPGSPNGNNPNEPNDADIKEMEDEEDRKLSNDYSKPLREIMNMRGICNCSGHCGNSLILGSILIYNAVLRNELNFRMYNKMVHVHRRPAQFWEPLIKLFEKNNQLDSLVDIICFIRLIWQTVPVHVADENSMDIDDNGNKPKQYDICGEYRIGKRRWPHFEESNVNCWQNKLLSVIELSQNQRTEAKIQQIALRAFNCINTIFYENAQFMSVPDKNQNGPKGIKNIDFVLHSLFRLIMIHNYRNELENKSMSHPLLVRMRRNIQNLEAANNSNFEVLKQDIWSRFDYNLIDSMLRPSGSSIGDITLMRLLVLTMNFFVESKVSLDNSSNMECISDTRNIKQEFEKQEFRDFAQYESKVNNLVEHPRNTELKVPLEKEELLAIHLWTEENVCTIAKETHKLGISCAFRHLSTHILKGLKKLKKYDRRFVLPKYPTLFSGMRYVTYDPFKFKTTIRKFNEQNGGGGNQQVAGNDDKLETKTEDYCIMNYTFKSTTIDKSIAIKFAEPIEMSDESILLEIESESVYQTPNLLYGDISWISSNKNEQEVLISPSWLDIYINEQKGPIERITGSNGIGKEIARFGAVLKTIENIGQIWKNARESVETSLI